MGRSAVTPMSDGVRMALTHDHLDQYGGAERTLLAMCERFGSAPLYTSVYERERLRDLGFAEPRQAVVVSFMQGLPLRRRIPRYYWTWLYPLAFRSFDLARFDVVLSSATFAAKDLRLSRACLHVCYCYTPPRFLWGFDSDAAARSMPPHERPLAQLAKVVLRSLDRRAAARVNVFLASSHAVAERIRRAYKREALVVYPPVDTARFARTEPRDDGFLLVVSRLNAYKRIDYVVDACNREQIPLVVAGTGPWESRLRRRAGPTVRVLGPVPDEEVERLMATCTAYVQPGEEDFGIAAVEAMAAGKPVLALRRGGAVETVVDDVTGVLYEEPTTEHFREAFAHLRARRWDAAAARCRASRFGKGRFAGELGDALDTALARGGGVYH